MIWSILSGSDGAYLLGGSTIPTRICSTTPASSSALKRRRPAHISQMTTDAAYTSVRRSTVARRSCSGAMYAILPLSCPSRVVWIRTAAFATPKSRTRAMPSAPTITFCGDTSRWTISSGWPCSVFASWAACRPWRMPAAMVTATPSGTSSLASAAARIKRASDSPCTYSMMTKSSPCVAATSIVCTMFGCRMRAASRASSRSIETNSGSCARCGCRRLMPTTRVNPAAPIVLPRCTVAMPPAAMDLYKTYRSRMRVPSSPGISPKGYHSLRPAPARAPRPRLSLHSPD